MTTVRELYDAYAVVLGSVGLRAYPYIPDDAEWPAAFVLPPVVEYEGLANSWGHLRIDVIVLTSATVDTHQLKLLAHVDHAGSASISAAFLEDPSLGFADVHAYVRMSRPLNMQEQAGYNAFGALFETTARLGG